MRVQLLCLVASSMAIPGTLLASADPVSDDVIASQRAALAENTQGLGFGPQAPRDIDSAAGENQVGFNMAPPSDQMTLCDIHFHKNAEHKGGEFTTYAGNGDGEGYHSGYKYDGQLSEAELAAYEGDVCASEHGALYPGDTIEVHYVHTTARVEPGPTLNSCFSDATTNPQLRVEAQVMVLVNDEAALDFGQLTQVQQAGDLFQASGLLNDMGDIVLYVGSTTGPSFNQAGSPFQVTWSVRPKVAKVNIATVDPWCQENVFEEDHAHGVRNLVQNPALLAPIGQ